MHFYLYADLRKAFFAIFLCFLTFQVPAAGNFLLLNQINQLQQQGIGYYTAGGDSKKYESTVYSGITIKGNLTQALDSFNKAYQMAPERLDFAYSVASLQVLQGDLSSAENSYRAIEEKAPNDPTVLTFEAGYALAWGENSEYLYYLQKLSKLAVLDVAKYITAIKIAESSFNLSVNYKLPIENNKSENLAIVILGYTLNSDGSMDKKLIERLKAGLTAAITYPQAKIIVSGGGTHGGVTEAFVMKKWLKINGISADRIILEDKSSDTMANALNCAIIINQLNVNNVLLVTSANHIRRATSVFNEAFVASKLAVSVNNLVSENNTVAVSAYPSAVERALIVRDTLRTSGLWALPGMVR